MKFTFARFSVSLLPPIPRWRYWPSGIVGRIFLKIIFFCCLIIFVCCDTEELLWRDIENDSWHEYSWQDFEKDLFELQEQVLYQTTWVGGWGGGWRCSRGVTLDSVERKFTFYPRWMRMILQVRERMREIFLSDPSPIIIWPCHYRSDPNETLLMWPWLMEIPSRFGQTRNVWSVVTA